MVTLLSEAPGLALANPADVGTLASLECAAVEACGCVVKGSVRLWWNHGHWLITCEVAYDWTPAGDSRLRAREPIALYYLKGEPGIEAPSVWSNRADFPRDLPHLNPMPDSEPVSICISREGAQALYQLGGIASVLRRLANWLADASRGTLMHEGWDPALRDPTCSVLFDGTTMQELAFSQARKGIRVAPLHAELRVGGDGTPFVYMIDTASGLASAAELDERRRSNTVVVRRLPCLVIFDSSRVPDEVHPSSQVRDAGALQAQLQRMNCLQAARDYLADVERAQPGVLGDGVLMVLAILRPKPILRDFPCLAESDARRYELVPMHVAPPPGAPFSLATSSIVQLGHAAFLEPRLLRHLSGLESTPNCVGIVGAGALGGALSDHLARAGAPCFLVADHDTFKAHNVARHVLTGANMMELKSKALAERITAINGQPLGKAVDSITTDVLKQDFEGLRKLLSIADVVIDATADVQVLESLSELQLPAERTVIRAELAHQGRVGLLTYCPANGSVRLDDVDALLLRLAYEIESLKAWMSDEEALQHIDVVNLGLGCASATTRMPNSVIGTHAGAFATWLIRSIARRTTPALLVNALSADFLPTGAQVIDVPTFTTLPCRGRSTWKVRIASDTLEQLQAWRRDAGSKETGGHLYGRWTLATRTFHVVWASREPPGTVGDHASLSLASAMTTPEEKERWSASGRKLVALGSWHSHPPTSTEELSPRDKQTLTEISAETVAFARPALLVVTAMTGTAAHFAGPDNWST